MSRLLRRGSVASLVTGLLLVASLVPAVAGASTGRAPQSGCFTVRYVAQGGSEEYQSSGSYSGQCYYNGAREPATYSNSTRVSATDLAWSNRWELRLPRRYRVISSQRRKFTGDWQESVSNGVSCGGSPQPGEAYVCVARLAANPTVATLTVANTTRAYRIEIQALPKNGLSWTPGGAWGPGCRPILRYPAFTAVVEYPLRRLQRLERVDPHGFTIVTPVAVTDTNRYRVPYGAPHYSCGASCTDDVKWAGKVALIYEHGRRRAARRLGAELALARPCFGAADRVRVGLDAGCGRKRGCDRRLAARQGARAMRRLGLPACPAVAWLQGRRRARNCVRRLRQAHCVEPARCWTVCGAELRGNLVRGVDSGAPWSFARASGRDPSRSCQARDTAWGPAWSRPIRRRLREGDSRVGGPASGELRVSLRAA